MRVTDRRRLVAGQSGSCWRRNAGAGKSRLLQPVPCPSRKRHGAHAYLYQRHDRASAHTLDRALTCNSAIRDDPNQPPIQMPIADPRGDPALTGRTVSPPAIRPQGAGHTQQNATFYGAISRCKAPFSHVHVIDLRSPAHDHARYQHTSDKTQRAPIPGARCTFCDLHSPRGSQARQIDSSRLRIKYPNAYAAAPPHHHRPQSGAQAARARPDAGHESAPAAGGRRRSRARADAGAPATRPR